MVRACAWAIDAAIRAVLYIAISITFAFWGGVGIAVILIGIFLIEWFYPVLFEVNSGATPGKQMMGIWVIHDNGTPVSWPSSLVRNLLRAADFLPVLYGFGLLTMLANRDFKRLGDLAAGTLVVYREQPLQRGELPDAAAEPPPAELTVDDQRTLLEFAERSNLLSRDRGIELADILAKLTGKTGQQAVKTLYAYANWLSGRR